MRGKSAAAICSRGRGAWGYYTHLHRCIHRVLLPPQCIREKMQAVITESIWECCAGWEGERKEGERWMSRCIMELETHGGFLLWCEGHIHHLQPQLSALFPGRIQWQTALRFSGNPCWKCQNISVQSAHIALPIYRIVDYWKTDQR